MFVALLLLALLALLFGLGTAVKWLLIVAVVLLLVSFLTEGSPFRRDRL